MNPFYQAWNLLKEEPDEWFHRLNDPNPTVAFGAGLMNNPNFQPIFDDIRRIQEEGYPSMTCKNCGKTVATDGPMGRDTWDDNFCSERCSKGEEPTCKELTGEACEFEITEQPVYDPNVYDGQYQIEIGCSKCGHSKWGWVD